jgi:transcriptional regulator with XRE-family HTH domain
MGNERRSIRRPPSLARDLRDTRRGIGLDVRRQREDAGISQRALARAASISQAHLSAIEAGETEPSLTALTLVAHALGGRARVRIEPGVGPQLRDHLQAAMLDSLLASVHPRWARFPEVVVHRPVRGMVDVVLGDRSSNLLVATEIQSQIRRLEAQLRWGNEKAEALASRPDLSPLGPHAPPSISRLLVLLSTSTLRALASTYRHVLFAAYPAPTNAVLASLLGTDPWPGPGVVWMTVHDGQAHLIERASVGRPEPPSLSTLGGLGGR